MADLNIELEIMRLHAIYNPGISLRKLALLDVMDIPFEFGEKVRELKSVGETFKNDLAKLSREFTKVYGMKYSEYCKMNNTCKCCAFLSWDTLLLDGINKLHIECVKRHGPCKSHFSMDIDTVEYMTNVMPDITFVKSICVILDVYAGKMYGEYALKLKELELARERTLSSRIVPEFSIIHTRCLELMNNDNIPMSIRVLSLFISSNIISELKNEIGICRPSDFMNTYICIHDKNYINITFHTWHIKGNYTKNKRNRTLLLHQSICDKLVEWKCDQLITESESVVSRMIREYFGFTFNVIRAAYFTWRETTEINRRQLHNLCYSQGHSYSTAMINYKRIVKIL